MIECNFCKKEIHPQIKGSHEKNYGDPEGNIKIALMVCPLCNNALLGVARTKAACSIYITKISKYIRLWPQPNEYKSDLIPKTIRNSLDEAKRCIDGSAYTACAAMSGRVLEGICRFFGTKGGYLGPGIEELKERGVIDSKLFEWSKEIHKHRNIAAHASEEEIAKEDAIDLYYFSEAVCNYVFVISERFNQFISRKKADKANATDAKSRLPDPRH
ncbi:MAG: DUF4145 domain-containing protein [Proteobacteria bacterium]|nr:DUF4145 domain-containing protein [Pseudomonadota bacterium]MBU1585099.1 DUF4145 domain-containing protein [Pseudomonadota bacterium]MBU2627561.1 DUF4145 domain-containing protein [Pseudomonadota bacterium]